MMSTLAGLRRLEARIYHAMVEAGAPQAPGSEKGVADGPAPETLVAEANQGMARAMHSLDVSA